MLSICRKSIKLLFKPGITYFEIIRKINLPYLLANTSFVSIWLINWSIAINITFFVIVIISLSYTVYDLGIIFTIYFVSHFLVVKLSVHPKCIV